MHETIQILNFGSKAKAITKHQHTTNQTNAQTHPTDADDKSQPTAIAETAIADYQTASGNNKTASAYSHTAHDINPTDTSLL